MSGDDHGHSSAHGHEGPTDIIPLGSWQDWVLLAVCAYALTGLYCWGQGFVSIAQAHQNDRDAETHAGGDLLHNAGQVNVRIKTQPGAPAE